MVDTCCNKTLSISPSHYQRTSSRALHVDSNHFIKSCKCTMWEQRIRMVNRWLNRFHCHVGHCKCCAPSQISRYYTATATFFKRLPLSVFQHYFAYPHGFCWTWCQTLSQESTVPHFTVEGKFLFLLSIFRISAWIVSIPPCSLDDDLARILWNPALPFTRPLTMPCFLVYNRVLPMPISFSKPMRYFCLLVTTTMTIHIASQWPPR